MNVQQAIEMLAAYPGHTEVILARDEEGNGFHQLATGELMFVPKDTGYWIEEVHAPGDLLDDDEDLEDYEPRVVLWP